MKDPSEVMLTAMRQIAAGRRRNRSGFMQRLSRDELVEIARRALLETGQTLAN